jgi:hypothetical protein
MTLTPKTKDGGQHPRERRQSSFEGLMNQIVRFVTDLDSDGVEKRVVLRADAQERADVATENHQ